MRREIWEERAARIKEFDGLTLAEASQKLRMNKSTIQRYRSASGQRQAKASAFDAGIRECAAQGLTRTETAAKLDVSVQTVGNYARSHRIEFRHALSGAGVDLPRSEVMASMYRAGKTLEQIGALYGLTRERVRQIISKYQGIAAQDGGQHVRAKARQERAAERKDAQYLAKYGCTFTDWQRMVRLGKEMRAAGKGKYQAPTYAFVTQRTNARVRGIDWNLTLLQWWTIWQESGKWDQRGRGHGYMMCRFGDVGPYEAGNVYIATGVHNGSVQPNNIYRANHPRHHEVLAPRPDMPPRHDVPGARRVYVGLPVGVTFHKASCRYQAQICANGARRYLGSFKTVEEARDAYLAAIPVREIAA